MFRSSKVTRAWTVVLASQFVMLSFGPTATGALADDMPAAETTAPSWNDSSKSAASAILDKGVQTKGPSAKELHDSAKLTGGMPIQRASGDTDEKPNFTTPAKPAVTAETAASKETPAKKEAPVVTNTQAEEETPASRAAAKAALRAEEKAKADAARVAEREKAKAELAAQAEAKAKAREAARAEAEKIAKEREDAKAKERAEELAKSEAAEKEKVAAREAKDKERAEAKAKKEAEKIARAEAEKKEEAAKKQQDEAKKTAEATEESEKKAARAHQEAKQEAKQDSKQEAKQDSKQEAKQDSKLDEKTETKSEVKSEAPAQTSAEPESVGEHGKAIAEVNKAVPAEAATSGDAAAVMAPIPDSASSGSSASSANSSEAMSSAQPSSTAAESTAPAEKAAPQVGSGGTLGTADSLSSEMLKSLGAAPTVSETVTETVDGNGVVQEAGIIVVDCDEKSEVEEEIKYENLETDEGKTHIKTGARFPVVVSSQISSKTAKKGDPVEARLKYDLKIGDRLIAHKGAEVHGHINYSLKARSAMHSLVSPERWYRNSGVLGVEFDEIINDKGEHLPLVAMPARTSRIVKNKYEGRVLGVNHLGQVTGPLSQQLRYKAIRVGLNAAMAPAGVFSFGAMPVALGLIGAANPSFAFMKPVGQNVRHRRLKGFAWGFLSGVPGSWIIEDTVVKGQESIIKPGDEFLAEFHQDFNGEPATEAQLLPNATVKVHGDVRPGKDKDKSHK